jgi:putative flippase GtrA
VTLNRLTVLFLLLMVSAWVALVNGQPLLMTDSTAYVREPDFAVVYEFGSKFATSWTQPRTLEGLQDRERSDTGKSAVPRLNSPFDKAIIAGRSFYYGSLLYLGHLTSHLWLSVFVQAAIFVYLSYTLIVTCLRLSIFTLASVDLAVLAATPLSFYISILMPDVFASFLILATIILMAFWDALGLRDRMIVSAILLYATLAHTSHILLLVGLVCVFLCLAFVTKGRTLRSGSFPKQLAALLGIAVCGGLGTLGFSYATQHLIGTYPIQPPFLMARLITDGPGYKFLQQNCATKPYVVCRYIDRFPIANETTFLWSTEPTQGVFAVVDLPTRNALSSEQTSFALDVIRFDPIGVIVAAAKNTIDQFLSLGLREVFLSSLPPVQLQEFKDKIPASYLTDLLHTRIVSSDWIQTPAVIWYSVIYYSSTLGLVLLWLFWPFVLSRMKPNNFPQSQWFYAMTIAVTAMVFNAAICGALSGIAPRYQTRISWIPLFVLILIVTNLVEASWAKKNGPEFVRQLAEQLPRPLRFLGVGGIGLLTDLCTFTIIAAFGVHPLIARLGSLAIATVVTWRLNRALTFDHSGRRQREEAMRYAAVTVVAQGTSYAVFAVLVLTVLAALPQVAIVIGAAIGALLSYKGHRLLSFAPKVIHSHS